MRIAVCEDQLSDRRMLQKALGAAGESLGIELTVEYMETGSQLLDRVKSGERYDLAIIDIFLVKENGMETAVELRAMSDVSIAFVTSSPDYALQAYEVDPVHYLLKPVSQEDAGELFRRLLKRKGQPMKTLVLKSPRYEFEFPLMHIREIVSQDKGMEIRFRRGAQSRWLPFPFKEAEWIQDEPGFVKVNRGHLVNLEEIFCIDYDICQMKDGSRWPVSRRERQKVQKKYNDYLFRKMDGREA